MRTRFLRFFVGSVIAVSLSLHAATINVAPQGTAFSIQPLYAGANVYRLIDGDTRFEIHGDIEIQDGFAYSVDLGQERSISQINIFPRQDGCCPDRLTNFRVSVHEDAFGVPGTEVWGMDLFTDGTNPGAEAGTVVEVDLPTPQTGRWVQITSLASPVPNYALQVTELQVLAEVPEQEVNQAIGSLVRSTSPIIGGRNPNILVDGNLSGTGDQVAHSLEVVEGPFAYEINLGIEVDIERIVLLPRFDGCCPERLSNYRVSVHEDNSGNIGDPVWSADLRTDFSFLDTVPGNREIILSELDPTGEFKGQWIRISALDEPVAPFSLQMTEVEVYGIQGEGVSHFINDEPDDLIVGIGQSAVFGVGAKVINGDPGLLTYQWFKDGIEIEGASFASYTNEVVSAGDGGSKYKANVSYPGQPTLTTAEATLKVNVAQGALAFSNRPIWGGGSVASLVNGVRNDLFHGDVMIEPGFAYDVKFPVPVAFESLDIYPRQDGCCPERLTNFRVSIHDDNDGVIGAERWSTDLFTDGTNPGSGAGLVVHLTPEMDLDGDFEGQWIRIASLDDPIGDYALQMTELEAFGSLLSTEPTITITQQPQNSRGAPGRRTTISASASLFNGDESLLTYQWKKNGVLIPGSNTNIYTTPILVESDEGATYQLVVSYLGIPDVESELATLTFDYNYARGATATSNRPLWVGVPTWNIGMLVDGDRTSVFHGDTAIAPGFAYEVNLGSEVDLDKIDIYPRQDACCPERFTNVRVSIHNDNNGQLGDQVWAVDLFTDGTNPGAGAGIVVTLTEEMDPTGVFQGQWIRILSLEDPIQDYAMQMTELEAIGRIETPSNIRIEVAVTENGPELTWTEGVLESSDLVDGDWSTVEGATSPHQIQSPQGNRFYRLRK